MLRLRFIAVDGTKLQYILGCLFAEKAVVDIISNIYISMN